MKQCSRCKQTKKNLEFKAKNSVCRLCIIKVTQWNLLHKNQYLKNKNISYHRHSNEILLRLKETRKITGWKTSYHAAKQRCLNPKNPNYKYYGGRGIKFLMSMAEFKRMWFRDMAYKMSCPSIDREENDGNYEYSNCNFIEKSDNTRKRNYERANIG